jgi:hypothetical protein
MLLVSVCAAGILLGLKFKVLVLLPASLIGSAIFILVNLSSGAGPFANPGDLVFSLVSCQAGYMLGLIGRDTYGHLVARFHAAQSDQI